MLDAELGKVPLGSGECGRCEPAIVPHTAASVLTLDNLENELYPGRALRLRVEQIRRNQVTSVLAGGERCAVIGGGLGFVPREDQIFSVPTV